MKIWLSINNKKGFTLIELLVTVVVLIIVVGFGYNFYYHINRSFIVATKQSHVHQNVRTVQEKIEKEIRQASTIKILTEIDTPPVGNYNKIYLSNNEIILEEDGKPRRSLLEGLSKDMDVRMGLIFKKNKDSFIDVTVTGVLDGINEYSISSEILFLKSFEKISNDDVDECNIMYYTLPANDLDN